MGVSVTLWNQVFLETAKMQGQDGRQVYLWFIRAKSAILDAVIP